MLEFVDLVMVGGHRVTDFVRGVEETAIDAKRAADPSRDGDEIEGMVVLVGADVCFGEGGDFRVVAHKDGEIELLLEIIA